MMRISPLRDFVLVKCDPIKDEVHNGIIILSHQQRVRHGEVLAVGPGTLTKKGKLIPSDVKPGQRVAFFRENMETLNGKQLTATMHELSEEYGADVALVPESALFGEIDRDTKVTA
jgi:co-chaperonin GroES (HSP10)